MNWYNFKRNLEILINDYKLRKELGVNAKKYVKKYNENVVIEKWENLIKDTYENS